MPIQAILIGLAGLMALPAVSDAQSQAAGGASAASQGAGELNLGDEQPGDQDPAVGRPAGQDPGARGQGARGAGGQRRTNKSAPPDRAPKMTFASNTVDFGEVWSGRAAEAVFEFRNEGEGVLQILEVKPACGCTAAGNYDHTVYPGRTGRIPFTVQTRGRNGPMSKTVSIRTSDPHHGLVALTVQGRIKTWLKLDPPTGVTIGSVRPGEAFERSLSVEYELDDAIELKLETTPATGKPPFKIDLIAETPGKRWKLALTGQAPNEYGSQSFTYSLKPSRLDLTPHEVVVTMYVRPPIQATPSLLTLKLDQRGIAAGTLMLQSQDQDFRVLSALPTDRQLTVFEPQQINPRTWSIPVEASQAFAARDAKLMIRTDLPEQRQLAVQVMVHRQPINRTNRTVPPRRAAAGGR